MKKIVFWVLTIALLGAPGSKAAETRGPGSAAGMSRPAVLAAKAWKAAFNEYVRAPGASPVAVRVLIATNPRLFSAPSSKEALRLKIARLDQAAQSKDTSPAELKDIVAAANLLIESGVVDADALTELKSHAAASLIEHTNAALLAHAHGIARELEEGTRSAEALAQVRGGEGESRSSGLEEPAARAARGFDGGRASPEVPSARGRELNNSKSPAYPGTLPIEYDYEFRDGFFAVESVAMGVSVLGWPIGLVFGIALLPLAVVAGGVTSIYGAIKGKHAPRTGLMEP